jgi:hypothetical protein
MDENLKKKQKQLKELKEVFNKHQNKNTEFIKKKINKDHSTKCERGA